MIRCGKNLAKLVAYYLKVLNCASEVEVTTMVIEMYLKCVDYFILIVQGEVHCSG